MSCLKTKMTLSLYYTKEDRHGYYNYYPSFDGSLEFPIYMMEINSLIIIVQA